MTSRITDDIRLRRAGFAILVLAAHVAVFKFLPAALPHRTAETPATDHSIAWVTLVPPVPTVEPPRIDVKPRVVPKPAAAPRATASLPAIAAPESATGKSSLTLCNAAARKGEDPCPALRPTLKDPNLARPVPTDKEAARWHEFEHEVAVNNAPKGYPCVMGPKPSAMGFAMCGLTAALNGFKPQSYADKPEPTRKQDQWDDRPAIGKWLTPQYPGTPTDQYLALAHGGKKK